MPELTSTQTGTEEPVVNVTDQNITLDKIMNRYFIPPKTIEYYKWGQAIVIFIFFGLMFIGILFAYVYANFTDYQNRISVISNSYLFGKDPEHKFEQYMKNSQGEIISPCEFFIY